MFKLNIFFIVSIYPLISMSPTLINYLVIRNVGQGQWVSHVTNTACDHFDFGGENYKLKTLKKKYLQDCSKKYNRLMLSHADYDHYSFFKIITKNSLGTCWLYKPSVLPFEIKISDYKFCKKTTEIKLIKVNLSAKNKNDQSPIFKFNQLLLQGDASQSVEKKLFSKNFFDDSIKSMIVGHHGSRTSTSIEMLESLKSLKAAYVSARYAKYQHPHQETLAKFKQYHIPVLKTEDWGNIILLL